MGMFGYMTELSTVEERDTETVCVEGECMCVCTCVFMCVES